MAPEDLDFYEKTFEDAKQHHSDFVTRDEAIALCKNFSLQTDLVDSIWADADVNEDGKWNVDEFAQAMHRMMKEVEKREGTFVVFCLNPQPWMSYTACRLSV
jgi:Ca2+-binding EF-hand superfamily protein